MRLARTFEQADPARATPAARFSPSLEKAATRAGDGGDGGAAEFDRAPSKTGRSPSLGESVFRCKGNVYRGMVEHFELEVRGGLAAVLRQARDPEVVAFGSQRFLAASWYNALAMKPLVEAASIASGVPYDRLMTAVGTAQAERDIRGVYQYLLRFASPAAVIERLPRTARQYFDCVTSDLLTQPAKSPSVLQLSRVPECLAPVYTLVTEPFLRRALELAGARQVRIEISSFEQDEPTRGSPAVRFTRRISWT